jgi:hypothetical protein
LRRLAWHLSLLLVIDLFLHVCWLRVDNYMLLKTRSKANMMRDRIRLLPHVMRWVPHHSAMFARSASAESSYSAALAAVTSGGSAADLVGAEADMEATFAAAAGDAMELVTVRGFRSSWRPKTFGLAAGWEVGLRAFLRDCVSSSGSVSTSEQAQVETTVARFLGDVVQPWLDRHSASPALFLLAVTLHQYKRKHTNAGLTSEEALMAMHLLLRSLRLAADTDLAKWVVTARAALFLPEDVEERLKALEEYAKTLESLTKGPCHPACKAI